MLNIWDNEWNWDDNARVRGFRRDTGHLRKQCEGKNNGLNKSSDWFHNGRNDGETFFIASCSFAATTFYLTPPSFIELEGSDKVFALTFSARNITFSPFYI